MTDPIDKLITVARELESQAPHADVQTVSKVLAALRSALPALERMREESQWRYVEDGLPTITDGVILPLELSRTGTAVVVRGSFSHSSKGFHDAKTYPLDDVYAYRAVPPKAPEGGE